ncbi:TPA: RadC family protein [Yersinia enterocolitica]|uniref:RadC family protein n=1 Tax=Yersinia enterocolitica TaxID=630 RepID=UPI0021E759B9|nr:DNA repair protein RadC [Yersinia enterocolitica]EKN3949126.1 DNA repair protein RadC [Yersinia enterocolitica]EKN5071170.1 DNA repair protein RadC [Yersinia enterocolitica]EKN6316285.1 DNA repair protein RadC [Yersinia enterocolitica]UYJ95897.1 DNA repair protein RadC [Yersinia enterocolitica]HDL6672158.1 DNA repair protein RadC [Yersinia enterocolitica]
MKITLSPTVAEMSPGEQRTIRRALNLLAKQLREPGVAFTSTHVTRDWLRLHLTGLEREVFIVLWLDNQNRLLAQETLFTGTINSTTVHPRELVKSAMKHNAASTVLAHNHPSQLAEPSQADRQITDRLVNALGLVDVRVLDHLVVGGLDIVSFAERGWLLN